VSANRAEHDLEKLRQTLGFPESNSPLLVQALTHRSYAHEHGLANLDSNERLEFLGDAVLDAIAADFLYRRYPEKTEGELSRLRAALVRKEQLCLFAQAAGLGALLRLGKGEEATKGRERDSNLASCFEAVIGALFLETSFNHVRSYLTPQIERAVAHILSTAGDRNAKSELQEYLQAQCNITPTYRVLEASGADHAPALRCSCEHQCRRAPPASHRCDTPLSATTSSTLSPSGCTASTCSAAFVSVSGRVAVSPSDASCTVTDTIAPVSRSTPCSAL